MNDLKTTIKKVLPAVVNIIVVKDYKALKKDGLIKFPVPLGKNKDLPMRNTDIDQNGMIKIGSGSGFIVDSSGIIISNRHVVSDPYSKYTVITNENKKLQASVLARDPMSDIAILKIEDHNEFPFLRLGDSSVLELGESVIAIGNALGIFQNTVSSGIISGLSRSITAQIDTKSPLQEIHGLIQTDAAINPGNSGGPLVNLKGEVIGINIAVIAGAANIGFALPINAIKRDLDDIKKFGRIRTPLLGVHYLMIDENIKEEYKLPIDRGAFITSERPFSPSVIEKSPASRAGLKNGDIILEINGERLSTEKTINDVLEICEVGENLKIKGLRGKNNFELEITLTERK